MKPSTVTDIIQDPDQQKFDEKCFRNANFTPRSDEAFKRSGLLPEDFISPKIEHFYDAKEKDPEIAQIKLRKAI